MLPKLATFFNITVDELIGYEPQLSLEQIKKVYEDFSKNILKDGIDDVIKNVKQTINQYYSCFELLYYMGTLIVNHCDLADEGDKKQEYLKYADEIFKRVIDHSKNNTLTKKALNMRGVCLLQLGQAKETIEILPSSEELLLSTECLLASAYLQTMDDEFVDAKLQVFILKNVVELVTLLLMKSNLKNDNWGTTCEKIEDLIGTFNLEEINVAMVLNFYLTLAMHYNKDKNFNLANKYIEKYLQVLLERGKQSFEIKGDQYFNKIDNWIEDNLLLGGKSNRNHEIVYSSYLDAVIKNTELENSIDFDSTKKLIEKSKDIISY
ncbi:hypothetical protein [Fusobacterium sp. THCT1E2]